MEFNRNQFFLAGLVILLLGIQLRYVESFELNETVSRRIAEQMNKPSSFNTYETPALYIPAPTLAPAKQIVRPPEWLGWALISVGSVLILHSLAMKRPG